MQQRFVWIALLVTLAVGPLSVETKSQSPSSAPASAPPQDTSRPNVSTKRVHAENWETIDVEKSGLPLKDIGGPVINKVEGTGYTRELVRLQWRPGDPIDLYVVRPTGVANPPIILYLYNYTSEVDRFRDDGWCRRATKNGFAAAGFDSALAGQRFHSPRPMKEWFVSELQEALATSTHDVQMVLNYLASRKDLDMQKVGMFGQGSGGAVAILSSAADPRIRALDVINPWGDWPDWLKDSRQIPENERPAYLDPKFLNGVSNLDPSTAMSSIKAVLRIQEVLEDPVTPASARAKLVASAPKSSEIVSYTTAAEHAKAYKASGLAGWLESQLSPAKDKKD